jgi:hypothetical protein
MIRVAVSIPPNTTGRLYLPSRPPLELEAGTYRVVVRP